MSKRPGRPCGRSLQIGRRWRIPLSMKRADPPLPPEIWAATLGASQALILTLQERIRARSQPSNDARRAVHCRIRFRRATARAPGAQGDPRPLCVAPDGREHLKEAPPSVLRVALADKVHNARALVADYHQHGERLWSRFNAGRAQQVWYYGELLKLFGERTTSSLVAELAQLLDELEAEARRRTTRVAPTSGGR